MGAVSLWVAGTEVAKDDREGLEWSSVSPGGDDTLSVLIKCTSSLFTTLGGLPEEWALVEVRSATADILWTGFLGKPELKIEFGSFVGFRINALGFQYAALVHPFKVHRVYGPASLGDTSTTKTITTSIIDAIDHARTLVPQIIGTSYDSFVGINFEEDTESFFGKTANIVWDTVNNFVSYLGNYLHWHVYSIAGVVSLEFRSHSGNPDMWEAGRAKDMSLEFDAREVVWECTVAWGGEQLYTETAAVPALSAGVGHTQSKVLNLESEVKTQQQADQIAASVVTKLNVHRITGGSITIDGPIIGDAFMDLYPEYIRAGKAILVTIPAAADPYHTVDEGGVIDGIMYIRRCSYSEDSCEARLSPSVLTDEARSLRMLPYQGPWMSWATSFGVFNVPPRIDRLNFIGSTPDPNRNPNLTPIVGSMIPTGYKTDGDHDFGETGVMLDPRSQPKNVVTANYSITGLITSAGPPIVYATIKDEDFAIFQAVPEMVVERIQLLGDVSGSITIRFDKFTRLSETTTTNFLAPVSLTAAQFGETIIASSDPAPGDPETRKLFRTGDWIIINIDGDATSIKKLGIAILGRKISESYAPPTQGPTWVKRPASPSWPHLKGWS